MASNLSDEVHRRRSPKITTGCVARGVSPRSRYTYVRRRWLARSCFELLVGGTDRELRGFVAVHADIQLAVAGRGVRDRLVTRRSERALEVRVRGGRRAHLDVEVDVLGRGGADDDLLVRDDIDRENL